MVLVFLGLVRVDLYGTLAESMRRNKSSIFSNFTEVRVINDPLVSTEKIVYHIKIVIAAYELSLELYLLCHNIVVYAM